MFKIGNVEVQNKVVLAPMAGVCNSAFRRIIKEMGCGLIYAEMVSDKALVYDNLKTKDMLYMTDMERPIVQQIFGNDVTSFTKAAQIVYEQMHPDIIDINMGCPVPKIAVRSQAGSALLKDPNKIFEIVTSVVSSVPIPVTVKIRSGWDEQSINAVEVAKICEQAGAMAICVHPRTRSQGYSGQADLNIIRDVKQNVKIPVIGNGDIKDIYSAKYMLDYTKCDAIMIGRGVLGNPWLIKEVIEYIEHGDVISRPSYIERINMCLKHLTYLQDTKSEHIVVLEMRSHIAWYIKHMPIATNIKEQIFKAMTICEIKEILNKYLIFLQNDIKLEKVIK